MSHIFQSLTVLDKYRKFVVNPLDVNIAKIQFLFKHSVEKEEDFTFKQTFESKDPTLRLKFLTFGCEREYHGKWWIMYILTISNTGERFYVESEPLHSNQVRQYINDTDFFGDCKSFVMATCGGIMRD